MLELRRFPLASGDDIGARLDVRDGIKNSTFGGEIEIEPTSYHSVNQRDLELVSLRSQVLGRTQTFRTAGLRFDRLSK